MAKIKEIELKNFKFFPDDIPPLKVESKHLLMYGENGSGKSTLNWSLYTLLEAANKKNAININKYFDDRDPQNLLNIHTASRAIDAFVKVSLDDGTEWEISNKQPTINSDPDAQNSNLASDFINYRMPYRLLDFRNSQEIDLFPLFEQEVFDYISFTTGSVQIHASKSPEENIRKLWDLIKEGPNKVILVGSRSPLEYETSGYPLTTFKNGVIKFEEELGKIIQQLNPKANDIVNSDLELDITFKLAFIVESVFIVKTNEYQPPKYRIALEVETVGGKPIPATNKKPHIFLNEARLTAVGLGVRLAILEKRLATAKLKILVLDDLLISLDMSNRMKVVNMILKTYCSRYQVFILTHDRNFYELVRFRIEQEGMSNGWNFWEAFVDDRGSFERPYFKFNQSALSRANELFLEFDYPAAGNYMRKAVEDFINKWLPNSLKFDQDNKGHDLSKKLSLGAKYLRNSGVSSRLTNDLDLFRKFILNATSHASHDTPLFKPELHLCMKTLEEDMPKFKYEKILEKGDAVFVSYTNRSGGNIEVKITVLEPVNLLKWDTDDSQLAAFLGKIEETINNVPSINPPIYDQYNLKIQYAGYLTKSNNTIDPEFWKGVKIGRATGSELSTKRKF
jgi:energy-coupling factor transporter ATP-binding protein EcfA2